MKRTGLFIAITLLVFIGGCLAFMGAIVSTLKNETDPSVAKNSILILDLEGIIIKPESLLKQLRKYRDRDEIKAVVVRINSPGGVVGPSQSLYEEIKRTREKMKKPVVAYCGSVAASGAFYAAMGADRIVTEPGAMLGSMGVIMEFANLEKLFDWAKIHRFSITSGKFKDSGAPYRAMRNEERELFQNLIDDVHQQFVDAVADGRKMKSSVVEELADGRVFTGEQAVELGLADMVGDFQEAVDEAARLAGIKGEPELFEPPSLKPNFLELMLGLTEDESSEKSLRKLSHVLGMELLGKPLFLMPGTFESVF